MSSHFTAATLPAGTPRSQSETPEPESRALDKQGEAFGLLARDGNRR